jgi:F0F1-type ATP synthase membrane subunit b/b'
MRRRAIMGVYAWLTEKCTMPRFVWFGVFLVFLGLAYQVFRAGSIIINLQERSLEVARAEAEVAEKEKRVLEVADDTIKELEELKRTAPEREMRFEVAQMALREGVKDPILEKRARQWPVFEKE